MLSPPIEKPRGTRPPVLRRKCDCAPSTAPRTPCPACESKPLLPRLEIGAADDPLEREADRIADSVLAGVGSDLSRVPVTLRRRVATAAPAAGEAPASVHHALAEPGRPLDAAIRRDLEPRFGRDFSKVRIHADGAAARSAADVGASAYTVGSDIVFAAGGYAPDSPAGRHLLAHELAHVVQQGGGSGHRALRRQLAGTEPPSVSTPGAVPTYSGGKVAVVPVATCGEVATSPCAKPDPGREGAGGVANAWSLTVKVDIEEPTAEDVIFDVGHAFVEFQDSTGAAFTYGFYPAGTAIPAISPGTAGCVAHPDVKHAAGTDHNETYKLTQSEYISGLAFAQGYCLAPPIYDVHDNNCTTFAAKVASKAGHALPPVRSKVGPLYLPQLRFAYDNPNQLYDSFKKRDVGPTYRLTSDSDIRDAVNNASQAELQNMSAPERVRVVTRLLKGWVTDDDIAAIEKICAAAGAGLKDLRNSVGYLEYTLTSDSQSKRFHAALDDSSAGGKSGSN
ncbi:MAG TPA: DUF4157 domain-containing protein [Allosphingosinicella sp.]|jgi:hypothetical protein